MTTRSKTKGRIREIDDGEGRGAESGGSSGSSGTSEVQSRGIVTMLSVKKRRAKGDVVKVNFNEMGQPIGGESTTLAFFIGSAARRTILITIKSWHDKDLIPLKEQLWDEIKVRFLRLDESHKRLILNRADTLHNAFRTRLRNMARESNGNYSSETPSQYSDLSTVTLHWKEFVAHASTEEFKKVSTLNRDRAAAMEARYRKACTGYALLREQLIQQKIFAGEEDPVVTRVDVLVNLPSGIIIAIAKNLYPPDQHSLAMFMDLQF